MMAAPELHVLTDRYWSRGRDTLAVARAAIAGGADVIQLRDKEASTRELIALGQALRELTRATGTRLIVNDRVDVALAVEADGVHVGQDDMPIAIARRMLGPERIVGASAGTLDEALEAAAAGATYLGVGPIYATLGKSDAGVPTSPELLRQIHACVSLPLIAIGGITAERAPEVMRAGASGVAVITAVVNAEDITAAARAIKLAISL
jgi:thiamine-phosphate pyrophosphorylase